MTRTSIGLAVVAAVFIGVWAGGCEEEQAAPDVKIDRLISAENIQLKEQIEALKKQIDQCEEEKHKTEKEMENQADKMTEMMIDTQVELNAEIDRLRAEIATLKGEGAAGQQMDSTPPADDSTSSPQADENEPAPPVPATE